MAKATQNKKKQSAEIETLRETVAKSKVEEVKNKSEKPEKVEKTEKPEVKLEKSEPKRVKASVASEEVLSAEEISDAIEDPKPRKKPLMTVLVALLTVLVVVGLTFWFLYWGANHEDNRDEGVQQPDTSINEEQPVDKDEIRVIEEIDYAQEIAGANGEVVTPVYYLDSKDNFTLKFTKLNCDDTCSNVNEVKIGGKLLTSGQDYIVKREDGVTIVVYTAALNKFEAGNYELTFQILQDKEDYQELRTIGLKFEIKKAIVCGENQTVQNGQCVDKNTQTTKPENTENSEQAKCEAQEGPDYVYQVHWYSDDEKFEVVKDYGYDSSVIVSVVRGDFVGNNNSNTAGMKLINGVCRPNPNATAVTAGEKSYTESNLSSIDSQFATLVLSNRQRDILVYAWRTNSGVEYRMELLQQ